MKKNARQSNETKLGIRRETVRTLSGREMTTAAGGQYGFSYTCYGQGGGCSHTCYYYGSNNDW